jgi:hypothetical protein
MNWRFALFDIYFGDLVIKGQEWSLVTTKNHMDKSKKHAISNTTETDQFIRTANRYIPLTEIPTDEEGAIPVVVNGDISTKGSTKATNRPAFRQETSVKATNRSTFHRETSRHDEANLKKSGVKNTVRSKNISYKPNNRSQQREKQRIIIIGDSHARGSARNLQHNLNDDFGLTGFVKPSATIDTLISSMTKATKHLTNNDLLVFWGGSNDMSRNNSQDALKSLTNLV